MKIADLKRRIVPGTKLQSVDVGRGFRPEFYNDVATVVSVNSVGFKVSRPSINEGRPSHCDWPTAQELQETPSGFQVVHPTDKKPWLEYKWV